MNFLRSALTKKILAVFVISRVIVIAMGIFGYFVFPQEQVIELNGVEQKVYTEAPEISSLTPANVFAKWDTGFYFSIAQQGYPEQNTDEFHPEWNFMPLFPISLKILSLNNVLAGREYYTISAMLFSNLLFLAALLILAKCMEKSGKDKFVIPAVSFLAFYPGAIYYSLAYTESLFLFLSIASFWLIQHKKYWQSAVTIALLAITRKTGIIMFVVLASEYLHQEKFSRLAWLKVTGMAILSALPLIVHMYYTYTLTGDFLTIYNSQSNWSDLPMIPFVAFWHLLTDPSFTNISQMAIWGVFVGILLAGWHKLPKALLLYGLLTLLAITATGEIQAYFRYVAIVFPVFMVMPEIFQKQEWRKAVLYCFIALQATWIVMFVNGYGFAT